MLIPITWLREFVPTDLSVEALSHRLTMAGLEIEGFHKEPDGDVVVEVNVTPNRPDCLSVLGVARELSALTGVPLNMPAIALPADQPEAEFTIEIKDPALCHRYAARVVTGVTPGPSPEWMVRRLEQCGVRSIDNIVDSTNYVLMELGHPLHAFDLDRLKGRTIRVAQAGPRASLTTLDGTERPMPEPALMIMDAERNVAVAGVMGGADTEVTGATRNILIESAWFKPESVRRTAKALGMSTEASYRFERGTDPVMLETALDRTAALIAELAGGTVHRTIDVWPTKPEHRTITARYARINKLLGTDLLPEEVVSILSKLGLALTQGEETVEVAAPPHRADLQAEVDIVEEVARLHGFENIPTELPEASIEAPPSNSLHTRIDQVKSAMNLAGFHEAVNFSFMNAAALDMLGLPPEDARRGLVEVRNPLRTEDAHMRTMLLPALLGNLALNLSHGTRDVKLFECARIFFNKGEQLPHEKLRLGAVRHAETHRGLYREQAETFHLMKGAVESLLDMLRVGGYSFVPSGEPFLHPGKSATLMIGGQDAGYVGVLHPRVVEAWGIKTRHEVAVFELKLMHLFRAEPKGVVFRSLPRYPAVERDVALLVDEGVTVEQITRAIGAAPCTMIEDAQVFDFYKGKGIPEGKKSLAFNIRYRSAEGTLTDEDVERMHAGVVAHLIKETGAEVRGA